MGGKAAGELSVLCGGQAALGGLCLFLDKVLGHFLHFIWPLPTPNLSSPRLLTSCSRTTPFLCTSLPLTELLPPTPLPSVAGPLCLSGLRSSITFPDCLSPKVSPLLLLFLFLCHVSYSWWGFMRLITYSLPSALFLISIWTGTGFDLSMPVS